MGVKECIQAQRSHFATGKTRSLTCRRQQLQALKTAVVTAADDISAALKADLGKCAVEAFVSEIALVTGDIDYALKHLSSWTKPRRVGVPIPFQPASAQLTPEPLGVVLIISPWNYPFQLALGPLVSAIAAGNCAVLKPSEVSAHTISLCFTRQS